MHSASATPARADEAHTDTAWLSWVLACLCTLHRRPFDATLIARAFPPPHDESVLVHAAEKLGFRTAALTLPASALAALPLPALLRIGGSYAMLLRADNSGATWLRQGEAQPGNVSWSELAAAYAGRCHVFKPAVAVPDDPDAAQQQPAFGFRWFVPELLKHRRVWHEVLGASLVLQLLALGLPLFTQVIIDKVVVHRTESTLMALATGMAVFMLFTALLTWVRQYLILHTGNRVDAVLGAAVFRHLMRLPVAYFHQRPTGVVAARFQGIETIREFIASAAVSLILDLPFLVLCLAVMFWYSVPLTLIVLAGLSLIVALSILVAPVFRARLNQQFLLGARNQAFLTEYIAGFETVKSLQLEPQLERRYGDYLAAYLQSGFLTRQIGNTYQVLANTLEQLMTLAVLVGGAWLVMRPDQAGIAAGTGASFTVGMLVAFQMFAAKLSQPMLRLVGLWQQFQQARMSVQRLGDLMDAPGEPYSLLPAREAPARGEIAFEAVEFRYGADLPMLYHNVSLSIAAGEVIAIMGPSGCGKSTLTKLLLGFYRPTHGRVLVDGVDVTHLSANELRSTFGVVPQETVLFSGTVYDNVAMANPCATFEQVVQACRMAEVHDVIHALPRGYRTEIGERGAGLSGGQKQRLAIARALLKNPRVLIFDEATSALDPATAESFARTVNQLKGKVTMLFVAHALPRSLQVDEVFVIGGGHLKKVLPSESAA
jgi:ATP-binding cassette, subfamily B, bacterial HlyB/CyaB